MKLDDFMSRVTATGVLQAGAQPEPLLALMTNEVSVPSLLGWVSEVMQAEGRELRHLGSMMGSHPLGFRKLVIWSDESTGIRARVHLWPAREWPLEQIHDHRFHFTSMILRGGYTHEVYSVSEEASVARADLEHSTFIGEGANYFFEAGRFHRTVPVNELTVSFVLRSRAVQDHSCAIDLKTQQLVRYYGVDEELRQALTEVAGALGANLARA